MGASYRDLKPEETKMLQGMVDENYEYFIKMVAKIVNWILIMYGKSPKERYTQEPKQKS